MPSIAGGDQMRGLQGIVAGLLVLTAGHLVGADEHASHGFRVDFAHPEVVLVTDLTELNRLCRTSKAIHGCTSFADERLACDCEQSGSTWSVVAAITASPVMYLNDPAFQSHETAHIAQIDGMVRRYLRKLTSRRFGTADDCHRAEGREIVDFAWRMNTIRRQSNFLMH
jgi:hypothetical protein